MKLTNKKRKKIRFIWYIQFDRGYLSSMAGLSDPNTIYESLRPQQIMNSELKVTLVTNVNEYEYINSFGSNYDIDNLLNIGSGVSLENRTAEKN